MANENPSRSFDWWKIITLLASIAAIIVGRHALLTFFTEAISFLNSHRQSVQDKPLSVLHLFHLVVLFNIIFFVWSRFWNKDALCDVNDLVLSTFQRFRSNWMLMWIAWSVAYAWIAFRSGVTSDKWPNVLDLITALANIFNGFAIWSCFLVLDRGTDEYGRTRLKALGAGFFCLFVALDHFLGWGHLGLALSGLYTGLALACLVGRLGSHHIKLPSSLLIILYFYAMLQLYYPFFDVLRRPIVWLLFIAALVLKILLSIAGFQMVASGGLKNYLTALVGEGDKRSAERLY